MTTYPLRSLTRIPDRCFLKWASKSGKAPIVQEVTLAEYLDYIGPANRAPLPPINADVDPTYPIGGSSVFAFETVPAVGDVYVMEDGPGFLNKEETGERNPVVLRVVTPDAKRAVLDIRQNDINGDTKDLASINVADTKRGGTRIVNGVLEVD